MIKEIKYWWIFKMLKKRIGWWFEKICKKKRILPVPGIESTVQLFLRYVELSYE